MSDISWDVSFERHTSQDINMHLKIQTYISRTHLNEWYILRCVFRAKEGQTSQWHTSRHPHMSCIWLISIEMWTDIFWNVDWYLLKCWLKSIEMSFERKRDKHLMILTHISRTYISMTDIYWNVSFEGRRCVCVVCVCVCVCVSVCVCECVCVCVCVFRGMEGHTSQGLFHCGSGRGTHMSMRDKTSLEGTYISMTRVGSCVCVWHHTSDRVCDMMHLNEGHTSQWPASHRVCVCVWHHTSHRVCVCDMIHLNDPRLIVCVCVTSYICSCVWHDSHVTHDIGVISHMTYESIGSCEWYDTSQHISLYDTSQHMT